MFVRQVGYLCSDKIIVSVDDELLSIQYNGVNNGFINVSKFEGGVSDKCKEVDVDVEEQYSVKYFPRVYYIIFRLQFGGGSGYLLERFNGTSGSAWFYTCKDYDECKKLIDELEES